MKTTWSSQLIGQWFKNLTKVHQLYAKAFFVPTRSAKLGLTVNDEFFFDSTSVLVNSSQEDTFRTIGVPLVEETLKGKAPQKLEQEI